MEALRKPDGLGFQEFDTELDVQIRLGEMEISEGSLGIAARAELQRMKEMSIRLADKVSGFETAEKIYNFVRLIPVAANLTKNTGILLSM